MPSAPSRSSEAPPDQPAAGPPAGKTSDIVADDVTILRITKVAGGRRQQRGVHRFIHGWNERQRPQEIAREFQATEFAQGQDLGQIGRHGIGRQIDVGIWFEAGGWRGRGGRPARRHQLQSVKLAHPSRRENLEQAVRYHHHRCEPAPTCAVHSTTVIRVAANIHAASTTSRARRMPSRIRPTPSSRTGTVHCEKIEDGGRHRGGAPAPRRRRLVMPRPDPPGQDVRGRVGAEADHGRRSPLTPQIAEQDVGPGGLSRAPGSRAPSAFVVPRRGQMLQMGETPIRRHCRWSASEGAQAIGMSATKSTSTAITPPAGTAAGSATRATVRRPADESSSRTAAGARAPPRAPSPGVVRRGETARVKPMEVHVAESGRTSRQRVGIKPEAHRPASRRWYSGLTSGRCRGQAARFGVDMGRQLHPRPVEGRQQRAGAVRIRWPRDLAAPGWGAAARDDALARRRRWTPPPRRPPPSRAASATSAARNML